MINDLKNPVGIVDETESVIKSTPEFNFASVDSLLKEIERVENNPSPLVNRGWQNSSYWGLSEGNPYSAYLDKVRGQANYQAVWELAMQYEANKRILDEQREYDKSVLDEQREYESPSSQIARQRSAGINPDISGSGSSGSTSSGSGANIIGSSGTATLPTSDNFRDVYKEEELSISKWNIAANMIGAVSGVVSTIIGGISTLRKLPAELDVASAQAESLRAGAGLAGSQAKEINSLLAGKLTGQKIKNVTDNFGFLSQLFQYATPETDTSSILRGVGFTDEDIPHINTAFSELQKNPNFSANALEGGLRLRKAEVDNVAFSKDYLTRFVSKSNELNELNLDGDILLAKLQNSINSSLVDSTYAENIAESQIQGAQNDVERAQLSFEQIKTDAEAYANYIEYRAKMVSDANTRLKTLTDKVKAGAELTVSERHEMDYLEDIIPVMMSQGSQALEQFKSIGRTLTRNSWLTEVNPKMKLNRKDSQIQAMEIHFGEVVDKAVTKNDVLNSWLMPAAIAISGLAGAGSNVYKGMMYDKLSQ